MDKQSVRIGVDRFCYAPVLSDNETSTEYGDTVFLPGITDIAVIINSSVETFFADDGAYETYSVDGEKEVRVSLAGVSNEVLGDLTGAEYKNQNGLLIDAKNDTAPYVAIGFRSQKSNGEYRYVWIYKGKFAKADFGAVSKSGNVYAQPDMFAFKAVLRLSDGAWRQSADSDDENLPYGLTSEMMNNAESGWFASPNYVPSYA